MRGSRLVFQVSNVEIKSAEIAEVDTMRTKERAGGCLNAHQRRLLGKKSEKRSSVRGG